MNHSRSSLATRPVTNESVRLATTAAPGIEELLQLTQKAKDLPPCSLQRSLTIIQNLEVAVNARMRLNKADDPRVTRTRNDVLAEAINILVDDGWDAVTHARVAAQSGYSRATICAHWPERNDLMRDAFTRYGQTPHPEKSGDPEGDLRAEVISFSRAMVESRLERVLATHAERSQTTPEVIGIRDSFVATGERPMRETLLAVASGPP